MSEMTRRDWYICAALTGILASDRANRLVASAISNADAALAAAGEQERGNWASDAVLSARLADAQAEIARLRGNLSQMDGELAGAVSEIARLKAENDNLLRRNVALTAEIEVHHPHVCADYEAQIARLKRQAEPLTVHEAESIDINRWAQENYGRWVMAIDKTITAAKQGRG